MTDAGDHTPRNEESCPCCGAEMKEYGGVWMCSQVWCGYVPAEEFEQEATA